MNAILIARLDQAFALTHDLINHLDDASIELDLPNLPSNTMASQLWCVVGARESYLRAIAFGAWRGFSCRLTPPMTRTSILAALRSTHDELTPLDGRGDLTGTQFELGLALLEHEVQHHGQLIRFIYGNGLTFPKSWHDRYTVG